ncbi:MAG: ribosome-associated translation inhibitor RaiA [Alphaproteobacteria bacterium]|nr:ribosome-associated translation inhibitor RaiA [Alphaproteobacteria bacterium]MBL6776466.1 ribosome-associated translation inhibitor RaiA [Alphaproteobacteria bacterium]
MIINVSGQNMDTGAAFQERSCELIEHIVEKYFTPAVSANVTLEKTDGGFYVRIRMNLTRRIELEASGFARDAHAALEDAGQHAEKRLRRHKRRLKNHRQQAEIPNDIISAPMSIYATASQLDIANGQDNDHREDAEQEDDSLPIIAELSYEVESLSVEQAVMRLELSGDSCLLFRNSGHMGLNMVHLRDDGTIGWVDPRGTRDLNEAS